MKILVRATAATLACVLAAAAFSGCSKPDEVVPTGGDGVTRLEVQPVVTILPPTGEVNVAAGQVAAVLTKQYANARLLTDGFADTDFAAPPREEDVQTALSQALEAWEQFDEVRELSTEVLEAVAPDVEATSAPDGAFQAGVAAFPSSNGDAAKQWAEEFTTTFDAIEGPGKIRQLAEQMGQDAQQVYEQLRRSQETLDDTSLKSADRWDKLAKTAAAAKAGAKVGLLLTTGPPPTTAAGVGGLVVNGADALVQVGNKTSAIMLGEDTVVTASLRDVQRYTTLGSTVVSLGTLSATAVAAENVHFIGDALGEVAETGGLHSWLFEGKQAAAKGPRPLPADVLEGAGAAFSWVDYGTGLFATPAGYGAADVDYDSLQEMLNQAGVRLGPEEPRPLDEVRADLNANAANAISLLEAMLEQWGAAPVQVVEEHKEPVAADVAGDYSWSHSLDGATYSSNAIVTLDGTSMTIETWDSDGPWGVAEGTYDPGTGRFTATQMYSIDVEGSRIPLDFQQTLVFDPYDQPVSAVGTQTSADGTADLFLSKTN